MTVSYTNICIYKKYPQNLKKMLKMLVSIYIYIYIYIFYPFYPFVVSHWKTHPVVHLNNLKSPTLFHSNRKVYQKFKFFHYFYVLTQVKKDKMVAGT